MDAQRDQRPRGGQRWEREAEKTTPCCAEMVTHQGGGPRRALVMKRGAPIRGHLCDKVTTRSGSQGATVCTSVIVTDEQGGLADCPHSWR